MLKPSVDGPTFPRGQNSTEGTALPQPPTFFSLIQENLPDPGPIPLQYLDPFRDGRRVIIPISAGTVLAGFLEASMFLIPVDHGNNRTGTRARLRLSISRWVFTSGRLPHLYRCLLIPAGFMASPLWAKFVLPEIRMVLAGVFLHENEDTGGVGRLTRGRSSVIRKPGEGVDEWNGCPGDSLGEKFAAAG